MTTPTERMRNLVQAGAFLKELQANESLPEQFRIEANRLLRHYPTLVELQMVAQSCLMLQSEIDPEWVKNYRFGVHT